MSGARTGVRWRPAALALFGAAALLFALGIVLRSPVPLFLALPLLIAPIAAPLAGPRGDPLVHVDTEVEGAGPRVRFTARIRPEPPTRPEDLAVGFDRPSILTETRPPERTVEAGSLCLAFEWRTEYPILERLTVPEVRWQDPLGLAERPARLTGEETLIERYPPELARAGAVRLRRTVPLPGESRSRSLGTAGEFYGVREALPGDPPRRINWRASARAGHRLANEFILERTGDLLLVLDVRPSSLGPATDRQLLAVSRAAAHGLTEAFLREKNRVGLAVYGEFVAPVPLGLGRAHRVRLRRALLAASTAPSGGPAERGAVAITRYFPRGVTTVVLSPLADEEQALFIAHLRRRGYPVLVLSPSFLSVVPPDPRLAAEDQAIARRVVRLLRRETVRQVWREAPVVDWEDFWSLGGFVNFLRRPSPHERSW